jgi:predicted HicB family RNase H-like nuclease
MPAPGKQPRTSTSKRTSIWFNRQLHAQLKIAAAQVGMGWQTYAKRLIVDGLERNRVQNPPQP